MQPREQLLIALQSHVHQHHRAMRVADHLPYQRVTALAIAIVDADGKPVGIDVVELVNQIAPLFMEERLPIGDQELHVASLRAIDGRAVDFVEDSVRDREPDLAGDRIGRADGVFGAGRPARFEAGRAEGQPLAVQPSVARNRIGHPSAILSENAASCVTGR